MFRARKVFSFENAGILVAADGDAAPGPGSSGHLSNKFFLFVGVLRSVFAKQAAV